MKKEIYNGLCLIFVLVVFTSCYDDKGNYDYQAISKANVTDLEENYVRIAYQDTLHIEPRVTSTASNEKFAFLWTLNPKYNNSASGKIETDTIGRERILDFPVDLKKGNYDIILKITDTGTGLEQYFTTSLEVTSAYSTGYYVLKDMGGYTELDGHLPDGSVGENLLEKSLGRRISEKPTSLGVNSIYYYFDNNTGTYASATTLNICAGKEIEILNLADLTEIYSHSSMFMGDVPDEIPLYMSRGLYSANYLSSKGCYFTYQSGGEANGLFAFPAESCGEVHPNINVIFQYQYYLFDEKEGRFLGWDYYNGDVYEFDESPDDKFSSCNIKHKLIHFGRNNIESCGYALFEDEQNPGKHYLYTLLLELLQIDSGNPVQNVITIDPASGLNAATLFATNELTAEVIYFVNNNKLYMYDVNGNTETELRPEGLPGDEEITYVSNRYWTSSLDPENNFDYLVIGTYKEGQYKIYMYNMLGGEPMGAPQKILKGKGKVVKLQYTSSKMGLRADATDYPISF